MSKLNKKNKTNIAYCRLCLEEPQNLSTIINLYKSKKIERSITSTVLTHLSFLAIRENDDYSKIICKECWSIVNNFHSFYERIQDAQNILFTTFVTDDERGADIDNDDRDKLDANIKNECDNQTIKLEFNDVSQLQPEITLIEPDNPEHQKISIRIKRDIEDEDDEDVADEDKNDDDDYEPNNSEISADDQTLDKNKDDISNNSLSDNLSDNNEELKSIESCKVSKVNKKKPSKRNDEKKSTIKKCITGKRQADIVGNDNRRKEFENNNEKIREYFNMECPLCQHKFQKYTDVRKHFRSIHQQNRGYLICCGGQRFYLLHQMLDHILVHINPDTFKCDKCEKTYSNRRQYKIHISNHDPNIERFKCNQCTKTFAKIYKLKYHIRRRHYTEDDKKFACSTCGKKFLTEPFLTKHIERMHTMVPLSAEFICDICAKQFASKYLLSNHIKVVHLQIESQTEMLQCNICEKWIKTQKGLREHKITHQFVPSTCKICSKIFKNPRSLQTHIAKVHQAAILECNICKKAFKNSTSLREHIATHTGQDLYSCPYCTQTFKSNGNLHQHRKKDHSVEFERDRGKRTLQKLFT